MNAVEQVREMIRPGVVFDVENTYHDNMRRVRVGDVVQKASYRCDVLSADEGGGPWAGQSGCWGSIPTRVGDVLSVDATSATFKLRGPKGPERLEGHTVTLRRVA